MPVASAAAAAIAPLSGRLPIQVIDLTAQATAHAAAAGPSVTADDTAVVTPVQVSIPDDREHIKPGDRTLLIIEDDPTFARILLDAARAHGFKGVVSLLGDTGLSLIRRFKPAGVTLDLRLPDTDGWTILDRIKHDGQLRHIPVEIISALGGRQRARRMGAFGFLEKPAAPQALQDVLAGLAAFAERPVKRLLVVEDDERERATLVELIGDSGVEITAVGSGKDALAALRAQDFKCMVLDLGLPDMPGLELLQRIKRHRDWRELPIIVYTGRDLSKREEIQLKRLSETIIIKDVKSPERLLAETSLYLHRADGELPEQQRKMLRELDQKVPELAGRKVLVVDDDVRNIFAITSALERYDIVVQFADNGKEGLELLEKTGDFDAILMDIMMPEMDGYEIMRRIRANDRWKTLPIIALTAKAMRTDREKCIEAGASDYIAKPVEMDKLLSTLRVWLTK
jgi:CheY-like chemotaxis protein